MDRLFTSESVSPGHPDKICDQISDAVLDASLERNQKHGVVHLTRVACETLVKANRVILAGEVRDHFGDLRLPAVDYPECAAEVLKSVGYTDVDSGFDVEDFTIDTSLISRQSEDIEYKVDHDELEQLGAGDQGIIFGYACDDTDVYMPAPIHYAHRLMQRHGALIREGVCEWLRPDAKCQVTFIYDENACFTYIHRLVFSTQHAPGASKHEIRDFVHAKIIEKEIPKHLLPRSKDAYLINPKGRFIKGGPAADCGLTGRKIIVDTYGGMARHGGGCFSGKDATKVDRSAAYAARHLAKNIVAAKLARRCEVQVAYAIGIADPVAIAIDTFGTASPRFGEERVLDFAHNKLGFRPGTIIKRLDLLRPIFRQTASRGHFGDNRAEFTWEHLDIVDDLIS